MSNIGWQNVINESKKYDSTEFLRVKPDSKMRVRLLGNPVKVVKVFTHDRKCIIVDNEETAEKLKEKYSDVISDISVRFSCWCIDRDSQSLKILDMPVTVARGFGNRAEIVGKKISGRQEGCDWAIVPNGKTGKNVRYEVVYVDETPLTEEEVKMLEERKSDEDRHFDLTKIYKSVSFEEAEERLL